LEYLKIQKNTKRKEIKDIINFVVLHCRCKARSRASNPYKPTSDNTIITTSIVKLLEDILQAVIGLNFEHGSSL
jgi:hypothetical protein